MPGIAPLSLPGTLSTAGHCDQSSAARTISFSFIVVEVFLRLGRDEWIAGFQVGEALEIAIGGPQFRNAVK